MNLKSTPTRSGGPSIVRLINKPSCLQLWLLTVLLIFPLGCGLSSEAPESYGIYAEVDGKWVLLREGNGEEESGTRINPGTRFLVYLPDATSLVGSDDGVKLLARGKIKRMVEKTELIEEQWEYRVHPNEGDPFAVFELERPLRMKPGQREGAIELVPDDAQPAGFYALVINRKQYPLQVAAKDGEVAPEYDHWFETTASGSYWDQFETMSNRGMFQRNVIDGRAIRKDYFRSSGDLDQLMIGNLLATKQDFASRLYRKAYLGAYGLRHYFESAGDLEKILEQAPLKALDALEKDPPEDVEERVAFWLKIVPDRPEVVERGRRITEEAVLRRIEALARAGDPEAFRKAVDPLYRDNPGVELRLRLKRLRDEVRSEAALAEVRRLLKTGDYAAAFSGAVEIAGSPDREEEPTALVRRAWEGLTAASSVRGEWFEVETSAKPWEQDGYLGGYTQVGVAFDPSGNALHLHNSPSFGWKLARMRLPSGEVSFLGLSDRRLSFRRFSLSGLLGVSGTVPTRPGVTLSGAGKPQYKLEYASVGSGSVRAQSLTIDEMLEGWPAPDGERIVLLPRNTREGPLAVSLLEVGGSSIRRVPLPFESPRERGSLTDPGPRVTFDRDARYAAVALGGGLAVIDLRAGKVLWAARAPERLGELIGVSGEGLLVHYLTSGLGGLAWRVFDSRTESVRELSERGARDRAFSGEADLAAEVRNEQVRLFRLSDGAPLGAFDPAETLDLQSDPNDPHALDLSRDGQRIAVTFTDGTAAVFLAARRTFEEEWSRGLAAHKVRAPWVGVWRNQDGWWLEYSADGLLRIYGKDGSLASRGNWYIEGNEIVLRYYNSTSRYEIVRIDPDSYTIKDSRETYYGKRQKP